MATFTGTAGNESLGGSTGADSINGAGGTDTLGGLGGADTMTDSGSNDTFLVSSTADFVTDTGSNGLVQSSVSWSLNSTHSTGVDRLTLTGTGAITGTGNTNADTLISSSTGTDTLIGNATTGSDTFYVNHAGDRVSENGTGGADLVVSTTSFSLAPTYAATIENLTLTGSTNLSATGNALANTITGNTGTDIFNDGGTGANDTMIGNSTHGTDTFTVSNAGDVVSEANTATTALINASVNYDMSAHATTVNKLTLTGSAALSAAGNANTDILTSNTGADTLTGNSAGGTDTFFVKNSSDVVNEANTATTALVSSTVSFNLNTNGTTVNQLTLTGTAALSGTGNTNNDVLISNTGVDHLIGNSTVVGGGDTFIVNNAGDYITESGSTAAALVESNTSWNLSTTHSTGVDHLTLIGSTTTTNHGLTATGATSGSILTDATSGTGAGSNHFIGESATGGDTFFLTHAGDTVSELGAGTTGNVVNSNISVSFAGTSGAHLNDLDLSSGGTANLSGTGNILANKITGDTGSDTLNDGGVGGSDTLIGHSTNGTDTFIVANAGDVISEANTGTTALISSSVSFDLGTVTPGSVNHLTLTGSAALTGTGNTSADILTSSATGTDVLIGNSSVGGDTFVVNHSGDIVTEAGTSNAGDIVISNTSFNLLTAGPSATNTNVNNLTVTGSVAAALTGNNTGGILTSNTGKDTLVGNSTSGADTFVINNAGDVVSEAGTVASSDVIISSTTFSLLASTHTAAMSHLTLTGAGTATGNHLADILTSSSTAVDKLIGNSTNGGDTFFVNHASDTVTELGGSTAANVVISTATVALGTGIQNLTLTGTGALTGTGNTLANVITGNANTSGNTVLNDGGLGGAGDTLIGNSTHGTDTFFVNNTSDVVSEATAGGAALINSTVSIDLTAVGIKNINNLTLNGATATTNHGLTATGTTHGSILTDATTGTGAGANTLVGNSDGVGSDADTFIVTHANDVITIAGSGNGDVVQTVVSYTLGTGMAALTLSGSTALKGVGNATADILTSSTTGIDTLIGNSATGHDTFVVNHAGDSVTETVAGQTGNLVISNQSFTLGANLNALTLTGSSALTGVGNTTSNVLTSNTGRDVLIGHDTAVGTNDTFVVNNALDTVSEAGTATNDAVISGVSWTLGTSAHFTSLTLTGSANLTGTGNTVGNILTSNTGHDTLIGNSASGADTFVVNNAADVITEHGSVTNDAVISAVNWTLAAGKFADLTLTGTSALTGTGNAAANHITGNANTSGNTVLSDGGAGGAGDTMIGNSTHGSDTFFVNNTGDSLTETNAASGGARAFVSSTVSWALGANFEDITLTGSGHGLTATGSTSDGVLTDTTTGTGDNTLIGHSAGGNDTFFVYNTGDVISEANTGGTAEVFSTAGLSLAGSNVDKMTLQGAATGATITGNGDNDTIIDNSTGGHNILTDGSNGGHDSFVDNAGNDTFIIHNVADVINETVAGTAATVQSSINYTLGTNLNNLTLLAGAATNATGNAAGGNILTGNTNNDVLNDNNGTAADTMIGHSTGSGDTFMIYNVGDTISEAGTATGSVALIEKTGNLSYSLAGSGVHKLQFTGTGDDSGVGTGGGDTIIGSSGNDTLSDGGAGAGGDSLQGHSGTGGDTFIVNNANDTINEAANIGTDKNGIVTSVFSNGFNSLTGSYAGFYNLTLTGSTDAAGTGNILANTIIGNTGNDTLSDGNVGGGADTIVGNSASGADTFIISNAADSITEVNPGTAALVSSDVSYALTSVGGNGAHQLTLTGTTGLSGTGTTGTDTIIGNSGNDTLSDGGAGGAGDHLTGNSTVVGGGDTFIVSNATDVVTESASGTAALIESSASSFSLAGTGVHNLTLTGAGAQTGTGSAGGGDTITGTTSNDVLSDSGADTGAGDALVGNSTGSGDTFVISNAADTITETNGVGAGSQINAAISFTLGLGFTKLDLINTSGSITGAGNGSNDLITDNSTSGGNVLTDANAGGHDTFIDNAGNDTFILSYAGDSVTEAHASTSAEVDSKVSFSLNGTGINNLTLLGAGNLTATGDAAGGNLMKGNTGNDILDDNGATAADTLIGDSTVGHDTFIVSNTADSVSENGAGSSNLVEASHSFDLNDVGGTGGGANRLTLTGSGTGLTATGNNGADILTDSTTGSGGNILHSGTGVTTLTDNSTGGGDTFIVGNTGDTIAENGTAAGTVEFDTGATSVVYTVGTNIANVIMTGTGSDTITGDSTTGHETIRASSDSASNTEVISDGVAGGIGNDTFIAGSTANDHDTFIINNANDSIVGSNTGDAADLIQFNMKNASFNLGTNSTDINNLTITGTGTGNDTITANSGNDSITALNHANTFNDGGTHDGSGIVTNAGGNDTFHGGGGFDVFNINNSNDVIVEATPGQYLINSWASYTLTTNLANLTLQGTADLSGTATTVGGAVIVGNTGSDVLSDGGDTTVGVGDTLVGNSTVTTVGGGDTFIVSNAADTVSELGSGLGTVEASVNFTLGTNLNNLFLTGISDLTGTGNSAAGNANVIVGNTGNDTLSDGGNDTAGLTGNNADTMIGHSSGHDTFFVYNAGDHVTELGSGTASVIEAYTDFSLVNTNVNTLILNNTAANYTATGNNGNDSIVGAAALTTFHDHLVSGLGVDTLVGNSVDGTDTFDVNNASDVVHETNYTADAALINTTVSINLSSANVTHVDNATLTGAANATITGSGAKGVLDASAATGNVILDDHSVAGGDETMKGGSSGHDTFIISDASDSIVVQAGAINTIETSLTSYTLIANESNLIFTGAGADTGTGNANGGNVLTGSTGSDVLADNAAVVGADTMHGNSAAGTDTFVVYNANDVISETHLGLVQFKQAGAHSFTLSTNVNTIDASTVAGNDTLIGNSGADKITGSTGTDVLNDGGFGSSADTLIGNSAVNGTDTFIISNAADIVSETNAGTTALIETSASFSLVASANMVGVVNQLTGTGDANITLTANNNADTLIGNFGDDIFHSGTGVDSMAGNSIDGSDTFYVNNASDTITETVLGGGAVGEAAIHSTVSFDLSAGITGGGKADILVLDSGAAAGRTLTGNGDNDTITDSSGNGGDIIHDGGGADVITDSSTSGSDTFYVTNAHDVITETNGSGLINFSVAGNVSYTLVNNVNELDAHTGSAGNDTFTANAGADTIIGGIGNDVFNDGAGGDSLVGHSGNAVTINADGSFTGGDTFMVNHADTVSETTLGHGVIESSISWSLAASTTNVNILAVTGSGLTATGDTSQAVTLEDLSGGNTLTIGASTHADTLIGGGDTINLSSSTGHDTLEFTANVAYNGIATINNFNVSNDTLNIDNIISGNAAASASYQIVDDGVTGNTKLLVNYDTTNHSYGYVQIGEIMGHTVASLAGITVT